MLLKSPKICEDFTKSQYVKHIEVHIGGIIHLVRTQKTKISYPGVGIRG